jgi:7-cyano-7-deazaguanine synthase
MLGFTPHREKVSAEGLLTKADIVKIGTRLGVDYSLTWTCYKGEALACGRCGSCSERLEAFRLAGVEDPVEYADA